METKEKILPNECSPLRWCGVLALGVPLGTLLGGLIGAIGNALPWAPAGDYAFVKEYLFAMLSFAAMYLLIGLLLRCVAKTGIRELLAGRGQGIDLRQCARIGALYAVGMVLSEVALSAGKIRPSGAAAGAVLVGTVITLCFLWIQTTWEEIVYRAIPLRMVCGNRLRLCWKSVGMAFLCSGAFMAVHLNNPEVLTQSGNERVLIALGYFVSGFGMYLADLYFGSVLPGAVIHWVNNAFCFVILRAEISAMPTATLFVDASDLNGGTALLGEVLSLLPLAAYILWREMMQKNKIENNSHLPIDKEESPCYDMGVNDNQSQK